MSMGLDLPPARLSRWEHLLRAVTGEELAVGAALFVLSLVGSAALAVLVICRLPVDYLVRERPSLSAEPRPRWKQVPITVGKNLLGVLLIVAGAVMALPGVPGQGVLTMVIGVMLLDFPGKIAMERRLLNRPSVLRGVNKLRARFGKEALATGGEAA
ncbi:MAG: hypothetical protein U0359_39135 [Byssovorax sp.]